MSREWKPGDVAVMVTPNDQRHVVMMDKHGEWRCGETPGWTCVGEPRPVVVIDPEDREQVARIESDFASRMHWRESTLHDERRDALHATLRSLITPPKPDEPQGLGAVVEHYGSNYVRVTNRKRPWADEADGNYVAWDELDGPVRVLSEGWRA
jgi:hypothetical protein